MTLVESYSHFSVTSHVRFLPAEINRTLFLIIFVTTSEFHEEGHVSHDTFSDSKLFNTPIECISSGSFARQYARRFEQGKQLLICEYDEIICTRHREMFV